MASNRQTRANRRNAQKSTGPRTPEGKAKIRFNALKYGIHADQIVLPTENEDEWRSTFFNFHDEFAPRTPSQEALVYFMASAFWNTLRCQRAEHGIFILAQSDREALDQLSKTTGRTDEEMMGWCYQRMLGRHAPLPQILMYSDRLSRQFLRSCANCKKPPRPLPRKNPANQPESRPPPSPILNLRSPVPGPRSRPQKVSPTTIHRCQASPTRPDSALSPRRQPRSTTRKQTQNRPPSRQLKKTQNQTQSRKRTPLWHGHSWLCQVPPASVPVSNLRNKPKLNARHPGRPSPRTYRSPS
jgi:hypothetical protein